MSTTDLEPPVLPLDDTTADEGLTHVVEAYRDALEQLLAGDNDLGVEECEQLARGQAAKETGDIRQAWLLAAIQFSRAHDGTQDLPVGRRRPGTPGP